MPGWCGPGAVTPVVGMQMPSAIESGWIRGFTGKVPARGDFVHAGLPRDFTEPWHDWQALVIASSRALMADAWLDAFLEAPVWRFMLPARVCGSRAVIGLMMPSVDKVGRYFPLTFAALGGNEVARTSVRADILSGAATSGEALPGMGRKPPAAWSTWLDMAEDLGRLALDEDTPPERLMPLPCPESDSMIPTSESAWWTDGGPRVAAASMRLPALPDPIRFASMLGHLPARTDLPPPGDPISADPFASGKGTP